MTTQDAGLIRRELSKATLESLAELESFREIDSTNSYLLERAVPAPRMMSVAIAEHQTDGRGRQGKDWYSPSRSGLWMSVAYSFKSRPSNLPALTLAVGATLADELAVLGVADIGLKWPNDLVVGNRKLGGILLESCAGGMTAVTGIGINMALPAEANDRIRAEKEPIDLGSILARPPSVGHLAARIIERLNSTMHQFDVDGFESFVARWSRFDTLAGLAITVHSGDIEGIDIIGTAQGIADDGALLIKNTKGVQRIVTGTVRVVDCEEAVA
jgi:BirA family biotin operon repressor/biotin-[acetyl-CoA-carboxylase] ligase